MSGRDAEAPASGEIVMIRFLPGFKCSLKNLGQLLATDMQVVDRVIRSSCIPMS